MQAQSIEWSAKNFDQLSPIELFEIFKLRQEVFVLEQSCLYPDIDPTDLLAIHVCGWFEGTLALYSRVIPAGTSYPQASIGRIVTAADFRGQGLGRTLVSESIKVIETHYGQQEIKIGAQSQLIEFYQGFGFTVSSDEYIEDGIPHIDMVRAHTN